MKKQILLLAVVSLTLSMFIVSCSDGFKDINEKNQTIQTKSLQENKDLFILSSERESFIKGIDFEFFLFSEQYIITKLNQDPSICDFGYIKKDSKIGEKLNKDIYSKGEGIQNPKRFTPDTDKLNFEKWFDEMLEEGNIVVSKKDIKNEYCGIAYSNEEWVNQNR